MRRHVPLLNLTPREQLRAGLLPRRIVQLLAGLILYGVSMAMMIRSTLGLDPWDVFHAGIATHVPLTFGQVTIIVGALVLLLWVPLRQWPGLGTVANVVVIGLAADAGLAADRLRPGSLWARVLLLGSGIVLNGVAGGLYIGSQLGPGPRDGLMTGLRAAPGSVDPPRAHRHGGDVLGAGWLLGGPVGLGTCCTPCRSAPSSSSSCRASRSPSRPRGNASPFPVPPPLREKATEAYA